MKDGAEGCSAACESTQRRDGASEKADKHEAQQGCAARAKHRGANKNVRRRENGGWADMTAAEQGAAAHFM